MQDDMLIAWAYEPQHRCHCRSSCTSRNLKTNQHHQHASVIQHKFEIHPTWLFVRMQAQDRSNNRRHTCFLKDILVMQAGTQQLHQLLMQGGCFRPAAAAVWL